MDLFFAFIDSAFDVVVAYYLLFVADWNTKSSNSKPQV